MALIKTDIYVRFLSRRAALAASLWEESCSAMIQFIRSSRSNFQTSIFFFLKKVGFLYFTINLTRIFHPIKWSFIGLERKAGTVYQPWRFGQWHVWKQHEKLKQFFVPSSTLLLWAPPPTWVFREQVLFYFSTQIVQSVFFRSAQLHQCRLRQIKIYNLAWECPLVVPIDRRAIKTCEHPRSALLIRYGQSLQQFTPI